MGQHLPVDKSVIRRRAHRRQIILPFRAAQRRAHQFAIRQFNPVAVNHRLETLHVVAANLVAKSTRPAVNLHHDLPRKQAHPVGGFFIKDLFHDIHFNEMIAGSQRANLIQPSLSARSLTLLRLRRAIRPFSSVCSRSICVAYPFFSAH